MIWLFLLFAGLGMMFIKVGAMSVWIKIVQMSFYAVLMVCVGLVVALLWRKLSPQWSALRKHLPPPEA